MEDLQSNDRQEGIKKNRAIFYLKYISFYLLFLLLILITPLILAIFMDFDKFEFARGGVDGWLSYWGAYLGGIIGLIAIVGTTRLLINTQKNLHKEQMIQQDLHQNKLIDEQQQQHRVQLEQQAEQLVQQNLHQNKLIEKQQQQHREQLEQQNEHHIIMIEEQKKQHKEQLEQQRRAIEDSAKLQDKTERERYILQLELRKTEEFSNLLIDIDDYLQQLYTITYNCIDLINQSSLTHGSIFIAKDDDSKREYKDSYKKLVNKLNNYLSEYNKIVRLIHKSMNSLILFNVAEKLEILDLKSEIKEKISIISDDLHKEKDKFLEFVKCNDPESTVKLAAFLKDKDVITEGMDRIIIGLVSKIQMKIKDLQIIQKKLLEDFLPLDYKE